jgi:hypothetical protein
MMAFYPREMAVSFLLASRKPQYLNEITVY